MSEERLATKESVDALDEKYGILIQNLKELMEKTEQARVAALEKADVALNSRLEAMNQFRQQMQEERALYVTRDQYDALRNELMTRISTIEATLANQAGGRAEAVSAKDLAQWIIMALIGAGVLFVGFLQVYFHGI
jgi:glutamyl-tRNA reductase